MREEALPLAEAQRQFLICSACRYCEGYCATFPAIEGRTEFGEADVAYIANLCHDCRACSQACMYGAPHEFAVDIPGLLSGIRLQSYGSGLGQMNVTFTLAAAVAALGLLLAAIATGGRWEQFAAAYDGTGSFYRIVPFLWMLVPALALSAWAASVLFAGARRLVRDAAPGARATFRDLIGALTDGLSLVYMRGGGGGCYYPETTGTPSSTRRILHVVLVAGVMLAFAATVTAAFMQDVLEDLPPYPILSAPVLLGILGGLFVLVGAIGLLALKAKPQARHLEAGGMVKLDVTFLVLLAVVAGTGLLLLAFRATASMGTLLVIHLAAVAALFVTAPYGKFMHVPLRLASLVVFRIEEARNRKTS